MDEASSRDVSFRVSYGRRLWVYGSMAGMSERGDYAPWNGGMTVLRGVANGITSCISSFSRILSRGVMALEYERWLKVVIKRWTFVLIAIRLPVVALNFRRYFPG